VAAINKAQYQAEGRLEVVQYCF